MIYYQFGLPDAFRFEFTLVSAGSEDIYLLCSQGGVRQGTRQGKFVYPARIEKTKEDITADKFMKYRDNYLDRIRISFSSHIVDLGMGFPPRDKALVDRQDYEDGLQRYDEISSSQEASALYRLVRLMNINRLERYEGEDGFWPKKKRTIVPFEWGHHEVSSYWLPIEIHYSRQVLHLTNTLTWLAWTAKWVPSEKLERFWLCAGTPW